MIIKPVIHGFWGLYHPTPEHSSIAAASPDDDAALQKYTQPISLNMFSKQPTRQQHKFHLSDVEYMNHKKASN